MKLKLLATAVVSVSLLGGMTTTAQARHYGTPTWSHGYWHSKGKKSRTFHISDNHIWYRTSGWHYLNKRYTRFPWHGWSKPYIGITLPGYSGSVEIEAYDKTNRGWFRVTLSKRGKNIDLSLPTATGAYYYGWKLYRGKL